jgi:hypothetical protein
MGEKVGDKGSSGGCGAVSRPCSALAGIGKPWCWAASGVGGWWLETLHGHGGPVVLDDGGWAR